MPSSLATKMPRLVTAGVADIFPKVRKWGGFDVSADAKGLGRKLGQQDNDKLDEYLSGLRELERRIDLAEPERVIGVPDDSRPPGVPENYGEHIRLMCDLLVLAGFFRKQVE